MAINVFGEINVFDFMDQEQIMDIVNNRGSINVTLPCQQALDSGATTVLFPQGTYLVDGLSVNRDYITVAGKGIVRILLSQAGHAVFSIPFQRHYVVIENFLIESLQQDTKNSYGIVFEGSNAHTTLKNIRCKQFRGGSGIEYRQTVNSYLENIQISDCLFGILFQKYKDIPCTTATVSRAYITGCKRAISHIDAVAMDYRDCIAEYCGDKITNDGAYHFEGGHCQLYNIYGEANYRNFVLVNCNSSFIGNKYIVDDAVGNPPAPNVIINSIF